VKDRSAYAETRRVRQFAALAGLGLVIGGFFAARQYLWPAAALIGLAGIFAPGALAPARRAWFFGAGLLSRVVAVAAMAAAYYLVLAPVALLFRLTGRDALGVRPPSRRESYWTPRPPPPAVERYFRQF
jgi:hypothetical protein